MARTIAEIKDGIAGDFMRNEDVARAYGFEAGDSFTAHFSKASVESVLFTFSPAPRGSWRAFSTSTGGR